MFQLVGSGSSTMKHGYPCGGVDRRHFLAASAASLPWIAAPPAAWAFGDETRARVSLKITHVGAAADVSSRLGAPGLYPGQVIEVKNPAMIRNGTKDREAIKKTLERGLKELTG